MRLYISILLLVVSCGLKFDRRCDKDYIKVLIEQEVKRIDPRLVITSYEFKISNLVFKGLTRIDPKELLPVEDLAERIEALSPLIYRVCLKRGVKWHDGAEITSRDIKFTFESLKDQNLGSPYSRSFSYIKEIEIESRYCVKFILRYRRASFKSDLVFPLVPYHILKKGKFFTFKNRVVGSGDFRLLKKERNRIYLKPKEGYRIKIKRRYVDTVIFETIRDINSRVMLIKGGGGDISQNNIPPYLWQIFNREDFRIVSSPSVTLTYMGFNLDDRYLKNKKVRYAIAYAIDRESIIKGKFKGKAKVAYSILPSFHWAYNKNIKKFRYDPELAKRLLDQADLPPDSSGVRFTLSYITSTDKFRLSIAKLIAYYLKKVGIKLKIRSYEFGLLISKLNKGEFQLVSLQLPQIIEPNIFKRFFHSSSIPRAPYWIEGANRWRFRNRSVDTLLELGEKETDIEKRKEIYGKIQEIILKELPIFPLWYEDNFAIVSSCINYRIDPLAQFNLSQLLFRN